MVSPAAFLVLMPSRESAETLPFAAFIMAVDTDSKDLPEPADTSIDNAASRCASSTSFVAVTRRLSAGRSSSSVTPRARP